jgi:hypothetical protein
MVIVWAPPLMGNVDGQMFVIVGGELLIVMFTVMVCDRVVVPAPATTVTLAT